ncbi:MAG: nuclear transport factor 2 family protein [Kangiellaceae bacterium]|nr:nuclear transport factor 2 family protein [Kangiellaceae bacterium]
MKSVNNEQIESEVLEAFKDLSEAAESLDTERYFEFFDKEKFTGLNTDGSVWHSFDNLEVLILSGFPIIEQSISLEFNNVKVTVINPTTAILVNEYIHSILLKSGDEVQQLGGGTQVWSKTNGLWKLVSVSASESSQ